MSRVLLKIISILITVLILSSSAFSIAQTTTTPPLDRSTLQSQIQDKSKQLDQINQQIDAINSQLQQTKSEKNTLQSQVNLYNNQIKQLNLNINASQTTIQKLNLEVQSINLDINDINNSIALKQQAITNTLRSIQQNDSTNLLTIFLQSPSLADSVAEAQNLKDLETNLQIDVSNLTDLETSLTAKISDAKNKQDSITLENQNLLYRKDIINEQNQEKAKLLQTTKDRESNYLSMVNQLRKQQQEIADQIEALDSVLRTKIDPTLLPTPAPGVLSWPTISAPITQGYGNTSFAETGYTSHWHNGIDIGIPIGTPVFAAADGTVVGVANEDAYCYRGAYGKFIAINFNNNLSGVYGHLSLQIVKKGDTVKRGQLIGYSGMTGYATGPHLHFGVFAQPTFTVGWTKSCGPTPLGGDLDPLNYLTKPL
jgi:murein DD-endopeptidase MepM/ murein hydrolase activator NlpD